MNNRVEKAKHELKRLAAMFVEREANPTPLITVTRVEAKENLSTATIFFSTLPEERESEALEYLKRKRADFREYLKDHFGARVIPFIDFVIDMGEKNRARIEELSKK